MYDFAEFLEVCMKDASALAMTYFGRVSGAVKPDDNNQVLTEADIAVGKMLVDMSKERYPDFNIIDEEAGSIDNDSQYTIVIDPIDGTSNFAAGIPLFGIFVGILDGGTPIAGAMALPAFGNVYLAEKGKGAYKDGQRISVTTETQLRNSLVAYGVDGHQEAPDVTKKEMQDLAAMILAIRNLRDTNSAYDAAMTAEGKYGAYMNKTTKIWDNVAQQIVIEEAGGLYTDYYGNQMDYSNPLGKATVNFTFCAGAPALHAAIQTIIHANNS